jgi:radical SAM superfamily enzyme YgiQ (UPF0313 family)
MSGMDVLLLATYELGRQPFGLASPTAWLREAGCEVTCRDLSRETLEARDVERAALVAVHLPMHTATRLALPVFERVRALNPAAHLCAYGLYAPPHEALLRRRGVDSVLGPEFEEELTSLARRLAETDGPPDEPDLRDASGVPRVVFKVPDRTTLPPPTEYAAVQLPSGRQRPAGYTEASRGCKHTCRHCPVVPVYDGRFRIVAPDVVLADVAAQVEAGATHITFGDPDFFNGITHARRIVERLSAAHPGLTYDVTVKIEHLLRHSDAVPLLRDTGCLFVTSAVEAIDDRVLARLDKGHTVDDFLRALDLMRNAGLALCPTFVAFTPWTTRQGYGQFLRTLASLDLVEAVAPIQLALRLLIPAGSRLLDLEEIRALVTGWHESTLAHRWDHPDPGVDALQRDVLRLVGRRLSASRQEVFAAVSRRTAEALGTSLPTDEPRPDRVTVPYLTEPWYC